MKDNTNTSANIPSPNNSVPPESSLKTQQNNSVPPDASPKSAPNIHDYLPQTETDYSEEFAALTRAYEESGGDSSAFNETDTGFMLVSGNHMLGKNQIAGLFMETEQLPDGLKARIRVTRGTELNKPVHLCFGVIPEEGIQRIIAEYIIEDGAKASFLAHCSFPKAVNVQHIMEGTVHIGRNARLEYHETHYHGPEGGVDVLPKMNITVAEGGAYITTFKLTKGIAGNVDLDYEASLADNAVTEMHTKIYAQRNDTIKVRESIYLDGHRSRGLAASRLVISGHARAEVLGEIIGRGTESRGHVDCTEIIQGKNAQAVAVPKLEVVDDTAKLTHEAAIGSVDQRQVQTLMARGLSEERAVDTIVQGLLR